MTIPQADSIRLIAEYMKVESIKRIHFGSGSNILDGWLNTDLQATSDEVAIIDTRRPLPFPDNSVDFAFSEHHIEHMNESSGQLFIGELFRILKPGGTLRVVTPNLSKLIDPRILETKAGVDYVTFICAVFGNRPISFNFMVNNLFYNWGHRRLYDFDSLSAFLMDAGFAEITQFEYGQSLCEDLIGIERHGAFLNSLKKTLPYTNFDGDQIASFESLVIECVKPGANK